MFLYFQNVFIMITIFNINFNNTYEYSNLYNNFPKYFILLYSSFLTETKMYINISSTKLKMKKTF